MGDISKKTATSTSQHDGVSWAIKAQKWKAQIRFSNQHVKFVKHLGYFGTKNDKSTGELEAAAWRNKVKDQGERINEEFKDVKDLKEFKKLINAEIDKLK